MANQDVSTSAQALAAAREVAQGYVREQIPDMQGVEPQVSEQLHHGTHPADARRLSTAPELANKPAPTEYIEYIFTFSREVRTAEGYTLARIARVTVDANQHVVKAVMSK